MSRRSTAQRKDKERKLSCIRGEDKEWIMDNSTFSTGVAQCQKHKMFNASSYHRQ